MVSILWLPLVWALKTTFCTRGAIWSRPGLAHKQRSLVSISILAALGKQTELSAHVKGALNNGLTEEELKYRISDMSAGKVLTQYHYLLGKCSCK